MRPHDLPVRLHAHLHDRGLTAATPPRCPPLDRGGHRRSPSHHTANRKNTMTIHELKCHPPYCAQIARGEKTAVRVDPLRVVAGCAVHRGIDRSDATRRGGAVITPVVRWAPYQAPLCDNHEDLVILVALADHAGAEGQVDIGPPMLAKKLGMERKAVTAAFRRLERAGLVEIGEGGRAAGLAIERRRT